MAQNNTISIGYKVNLKKKRKTGRPTPKPRSKVSQKLPHVIKLLALAHHLQGLINKGIVHDYADIACLSDLSRARVTQIMNLTLLAPQIQEEILYLTNNSLLHLKESALREIIKTPVWWKQLELWEKEKFYR